MRNPLLGSRGTPSLSHLTLGGGEPLVRHTNLTLSLNLATESLNWDSVTSRTATENTRIIKICYFEVILFYAYALYTKEFQSLTDGLHDKKLLFYAYYVCYYVSIEFAIVCFFAMA